MRIFQQKRTLTSPLVCLFHSQVDPAWFTKENLDSLPVCTDCNLHLIPESMKDVLVTGVAPHSLNLDPATSLAAAWAALTMLWAHLNSVGTPILVTAKVSWDVWNPEKYAEWPLIPQGSFTSTFREGKLLFSEKLGDLTEQFPNLASVHSNLVWRVETESKDKTVTLWPKEALATLSSENYKAFLDYLAIAKESIADQPIWVPIDKLIELVSKNPPSANSKSLFGTEVVLHTIRSLKLSESSNLKGGDEFKSKKILELEPDSIIAPYGPDSPKRIFPRLSTESEMLGPFDLRVKVVRSNLDDEVLTLVHSYSFKLLVRASDSDAAVARVKQQFFEKFGLTIMGRENQNWLVNKKQGVDWDQFYEVTKGAPRESWLFSKIVEVKISDRQDWNETAWKSRLS